MKAILSIFFVLSVHIGWSQLRGVVYGHSDTKKENLVGAKVRSLKTKEGAIANSEGVFEFTLGKELPDTLVISAMGYRNDTLVVTKKDRYAIVEINLYSDLMLPEMVATAKREAHSIMKLKILQVENIGEGELRKAACCNLSESFETNASVDVNITDAVSGAKKIQLMGLDGVYTQIQLENIPILRGLESSFGLNSIPGTWIESMQVTKGTGNVVNGYESMAGLINLEFKKPENMDRLYLNAYGNRFGRTELNLLTGGRISPKWHSAVFAHGAMMNGEVDHNNDSFRDMPMSKNLSFLNRWRYDGKRMESQLGINAYYEEKTGGQTGYQPRRNSPLYGVYTESKHIDAFAKTGFLFLKKPYQSIGVVYQAKYQETNALFGLRQFRGTETRGYVNAIFDGIIGNTNHKIRTGLSFVYADVNQHLDSLKLDRTEMVPGAFAEYTYIGTRFTYIAGVRGDYHNLYGFQFTPRLHGKFIINEKLDFRFSAGKGFRVSNVMIDNISLLATSRSWQIDSVIRPEVSWNFGGSLVQEFSFFKRKASFTVDFYHTLFENQLVVDRDQDLDNIYFRNLEGVSFSNSFQTEISLPLMKNLEVRLALKYLDVKSRFGGQIQQQVLVPQYRSLFNIAYTTLNKRWEYDFTTTLYGKSRLPAVHYADGTVSTENTSEAYPIFNAQITHIYKKWDFYLGGENLGNYRQKNPIIGSDNAFGANFDATRVWAPVMGTNIYLGIRYKIKKQKNK